MVLELSVEAVLELSGEAILELSGEAVLELSGEAVLELQFSRHSVKLSATCLAVSACQRCCLVTARSIKLNGFCGGRVSVKQLEAVVLASPSPNPLCLLPLFHLASV